MIVGVNKTVVHQGIDYHIQIEDLADEPELDARVYSGGRVVMARRISYAHLLQSPSNPDQASEQIHALLHKSLAALEKGILQGRLSGPPRSSHDSPQPGQA